MKWVRIFKNTVNVAPMPESLLVMRYGIQAYRTRLCNIEVQHVKSEKEKSQWKTYPINANLLWIKANVYDAVNVKTFALAW
jgi:hypothetical protein